jgi:hypothetical protein
MFNSHRNEETCCKNYWSLCCKHKLRFWNVAASITFVDFHVFFFLHSFFCAGTVKAYEKNVQVKLKQCPRILMFNAQHWYSDLLSINMPVNLTLLTIYWILFLWWKRTPKNFILDFLCFLGVLHFTHNLFSVWVIKQSKAIPVTGRGGL